MVIMGSMGRIFTTEIQWRRGAEKNYKPQMHADRRRCRADGFSIMIKIKIRIMIFVGGIVCGI